MLVGCGAQKVYMDVCCINRPFDDLTIERNLAEAVAVHSIVRLCKESGWEILWSEAMSAEFAKVYNGALLAQVLGLLPEVPRKLILTKAIESRADFFEGRGVGHFDSLHLAFAERHGTVFLTTDARLLKKALRLCAEPNWALSLKVKPRNPIEWLGELGDGR